MKEQFLICACYSLEHLIHIWYDKEDENIPEIIFEIHLKTYRNFFKRFWYGLSYAFGYKCNHGSWDSFILDDEQEKILFDFLFQRQKDLTS